MAEGSNDVTVKQEQERKYATQSVLPADVLSRTDRAVLECWARYAHLSMPTSVLIQKVAQDLSLSTKKVRQTLEKTNAIEEARALKQEIKEEVLSEKVPALKKIVGLSLQVVQEYLTNLAVDKIKQSALTVKEVRDISGIAKDLNELLRLELGQSTQNVEVVQYSYQQTQVVLEDLRKIDPVFEYPELIDVPEQGTDA